VLPSVNDHRIGPGLFFERMKERCDFHEVGSGSCDEMDLFFCQSFFFLICRVAPSYLTDESLPEGLEGFAEPTVTVRQMVFLCGFSSCPWRTSWFK
jgi:hypothetical protein